MHGNHGVVARLDVPLSLAKLVAILDDEQDITTLFHDALRSINGITLFAFTDPTLALEHFQRTNMPMW